MFRSSSGSMSHKGHVYSCNWIASLVDGKIRIEGYEICICKYRHCYKYNIYMIRL
jgi:hypothetical protein